MGRKQRGVAVDVPVPVVTGEPGAVVDARVVESPRVDRVWVRVEVAHDGLYAGQVYEMVLSQRVQALIRAGYLEIVVPPDGVWPV